MKYEALALLINLFLFNISFFGQQTSINFPNNNLVYKNTETLLEITVEGYSCKKIIIKCTNAKISSVGSCKYLYTPKDTGAAMINVYVMKGKDTFLTGKQIIVIKERPLPEASIGNLKGGIIMKRNLMAQEGIGASYYVGGNHWESCKIENYRVIIVRDNKIFFEHFNKGNIFNTEIANAFKVLLKGDRVSFINITGCINRGGDGYLKALEFIIEE